jgi:mono/diheme cytochrome c family protein
MTRSLIKTALVAMSMVFGAGVVLAQPKLDFGKREYESNCAGCHGLRGLGDGPYKPFLTKSPATLTLLAKNNGGVFPYQRVYEVIDGRQAVTLHGPRDMPVWGADYLEKAAGDYMDTPYNPELYVRTRITALLDYINRLQVR